MVNKSMTLSQIIEEANKKLETERDVLVKVAKAEKYQGTVDEIMEFLDQYDGHFQDTNVQVVKAALETFLKRLSPPALKLTMASMKRQVGLHLSPEEESSSGEPSDSASTGGSVISQGDIDALLNGPKASEESKTETGESGLSKGSSEEATSAFEQSEIDALLEEIEEIGPQPGESPSVTEAEKAPETSSDISTQSGETGFIVDQAAIDALLAGSQDGGEVKKPSRKPLAAPESSDKAAGELSQATEPASSHEGIVSQSSIDDLFSQATEPDKEVEVETQTSLDQSAVEDLLTQIGTGSEPAAGEVPEEAGKPSAAPESSDKAAGELSQATEPLSSHEGIVSQSSIDDLFSQAVEPDKEIEVETQTSLDQSAVEDLLTQIGTGSEPAAGEVPEEAGKPSAAPESSDKAAGELSLATEPLSSHEGAVSQSSIDDLLSPAMESDREMEAEAQAALDQSSMEDLLTRIGTDSEAGAEEVPEETGPPVTDESPADVSSVQEVEETPLTAGEMPDEDVSEEEIPATGEGPSAEEAEVTAESKPAELPMAPDLAAGDVPLEIELPPIEPTPVSQQRVVDAIVEATRRRASGDTAPTDRDQTSVDEDILGVAAGEEARLGARDFQPERVVEERGEAKVLDTFYRVYAYVKGNYELLSESSSPDEAKKRADESMDEPRRKRRYTQTCDTKRGAGHQGRSR